MGAAISMVSRHLSLLQSGGGGPEGTRDGKATASFRKASWGRRPSIPCPTPHDPRHAHTRTILFPSAKQPKCLTRRQVASLGVQRRRTPFRHSTQLAIHIPGCPRRAAPSLGDPGVAIQHGLWPCGRSPWTRYLPAASTEQPLTVRPRDSLCDLGTASVAVFIFF